MNKFSMKSIPAAVALTAALAFSAHAQTDTGVRVGANTNISSDVRANATGGSTSVGTSVIVNTNANTNTRVDNTNTPGVRGAAARTGDRVGDAIGRAGSAVGSATERVTRTPRNAIKNGAARADVGINKALRTKGPAGATGAAVDATAGAGKQQK